MKRLRAVNLDVEAVVDDADYERLTHYRWFAIRRDNRTYLLRNARLNRKQSTVYLHREVMGITEKGYRVQVDHRNRDTLDNRRENLRICTASQNKSNGGRQKTKKSSPYKGVFVSRGHIVAVVTKEGERHYLGTFGSHIEAARAYDRKAIELFGEFALPNFPEEQGH